MTKYYLAMLMVRLVLPAGLLLSIALRPFGMSLIYLLLYLLSPLIEVPGSKTFHGIRGNFLFLNIIAPILLILSHAAWHTVLAAYPPYGSILDKEPLLREIGINLGLVPFANIDPAMAIQYLAPEFIVFAVAIVVYFSVRILVTNTNNIPEIKKKKKYRRCPILTTAGKYLCLFLIMFSGILQPSVTSGVYFLVFMGAATVWAMGKPLEAGFAVVMRCVIAYMAIHIMVILVYQTTWIEELLPPDRSWARYFGLVKIINFDEITRTSFKYDQSHDHMWSTFASPVVILVSYYILAIEARELFKPKSKIKTKFAGFDEGRLNGSLVRGVSFHRAASRNTRDRWRSTTRKVRLPIVDADVTISYIDSKALRGKPNENTPLMRSSSPNKKWSSFRSASTTRQLHQDSIGSVIIGDEDSIISPEKPTLMDDIVVAVIDFFQVVIRSSYIATTITMMAWSIMYHSWLTFVFLMWANIVWLCQDQRSFMLRTSPVLVCYAMLLLIAQYIYGMNLTEAELPSNITEVNLRQIGLGRVVNGEPCMPLLIKSLFTCMFWVTLRQRIEEIRSRRQAAAMTEMAAPLQLTVSTAASVMEVHREEEKRSRLLHALGVWIRAKCARYWIYVVVIMLFVIGITGERMTIFRIIYMFLFLAFILMFQISWYWWRRLIYLFWITLIIYSMMNLIMVYVYQFDNFSQTIQRYLLINEKLQNDLGLEPYLPKDLFIKLLTPTLFLIITIMQVHYFHKDFMELSDPNKISEKKPSGGDNSTTKDDIPALEEDKHPDDKKSHGSGETALRIEPSPDADAADTDAEHSFHSESFRRRSQFRSMLQKRMSLATTHSTTDSKKKRLRNIMHGYYSKIREYILNCTDKIFIFLQIHLTKIILVALMLLCVTDVCCMHIPIMAIISPALMLNPRQQRICLLIISILISAYLMTKMVYQIDYIKHSYFDVNCTILETNGTEKEVTYNFAVFVGYRKISSTLSLAGLLKGYIGLIALFTFYSLVTYRQQNFRNQGLLLNEDDKIIFPEVTRREADKDLIHCIMYLVNYGFYKFGVEITLICLMGVIGSRMDIYAVIYAVWLIILVSISRARQAKLWSMFTAFVIFIVPVQYIIAVGFLPHLCINFPWSGSDSQMKHVRNWLFLPYNADPPHATKLIFDYFLLLFAACQMRVFAIENEHGEEFAGGSNDEHIGKDWETPNFVNPVPDFLGVVTSWLDIFKRMIFLGMLWITLAIMFMTGTNRVNLFSMGYLIGSFIFLWQGTDYYLLPKKSILKWWSWLLLYNVSVVVVKTLLQIPGCMFSSVMQEHACWLVQLLGIGCVDKFAGGNIARFLRMDYVKEATCSVPQEDIGLAWDGVCFAFLILQRRLFHSYYFYRVIDESKATTVLASRGAELIEELRQKQMQIQEVQEINILEKIKVKMERIKANQKKIQGTMSKEPKNHDCEEDETQQGESEQVPLVRGDSDVSGQGYHTPPSPASPASPRGFHTPLSEASAPPSPSHTPPPTNFQPADQHTPVPPLPHIPTLSSSHGGPPSPSSALMTASLSLDAYLEPRRISFESPPSSDLLPRAHSPEESYPVFSPPPIRRRHTVTSPSLLQRTSIISVQSSRAEPNSHHTSSDHSQHTQPSSHQKAVRSGDYYMFDEFDDTDLGEKLEDDEYDEDAPKEMGIGKLLSTVIKTDLKRAVSMRRASAPAVATTRKMSLASYPHSYPHEDRGTSGRSSVVHEREVMLSDRETGPPSAIDEFAPAPPEKETWVDKLKHIMETVWAFIASLLVSITRHLMKYSRDYRYVSNTLAAEKRALKEKEGFGIGIREGSQMRWEPLPETLAPRKLSEISVPEIRILAPSMERGLDMTPPPRRALPAPRAPSLSSSDDDDTSEHESVFSLQTTDSKDVSILEEQDDSMFKHGKNPFLHLIYALWFAILAHTDIVCYLMVFINQIQSATILSIPLPLMVFLWGTLTIPRPTKTFWVTLIAYTEVIVLIKSMFQFEILPWNQKAIPANMPFTAPRIIGIERKHNYALYDLLLLLIIFLHRFMLKSLGLWKESTPEIELREDEKYPLTTEDTQNLVEGNMEEVGKKYVKIHDEIGPRHPLVDRLYHVQTRITEAMAELGTRRSDPRVAHLVQQKLQEKRDAKERRRLSRVTDSKLSLISKGKVSRSVITESRLSGEPPAPSNEVEENQERTDEDLEAGPSKPTDDDHYKVNDDQEPIIAVTTTLEKSYHHCPQVILISLKRYLRPMHRFFKRMLAPTARVTADIYAYMFLCDFLNFLVILFGFAAFGTHQGDGGVQAYLEENKVPIPFLVMLILQFALIVIDRALYLRKFMLGKILFQYGLIIGVHIWMFFVLPFITERTFNALLPPPMWYMVKCVYLLLSAYQIRCGYPRRIIGNFLCKSYNFFNMVFFRVFVAVPFVFELRTLMDWIWTDTSMTLMDWLKMEDIFASVFLLKCSRYVEDEFPQPRGAKKSTTSKYLLGGSVLAFVIAIIWFPLVFFAFGNTVGEPNPPTDVTVMIRIGPYLPVYQMTAQSHNIETYTEQDYTQLGNLYLRDRTAQTFLSNYMYNDVSVVNINPNSTMKWEISPPELERLEREAASNASLVVKFTFVITHPSNSVSNPPTIEDHREVTLEAYVDDKRNVERETLYSLLTNTAPNDTWVNVVTLFPKFLKVFNKGIAKPVSQLMGPEVLNADVTEDEKHYRDVQLRLERQDGAMYWRVREKCDPRDYLNTIPLNDCDMLVMYTFNDKLFPETLNFISGSGIIGLYTTFVFLASRMIRGFFSGIYTKIMFDDLPNVDRVLQLCLDIYLVREALELTLEEDLFAKLVFLYRSPETMIKWSRPKEEHEEQRALPPP